MRLSESREPSLGAYSSWLHNETCLTRWGTSIIWLAMDQTQKETDGLSPYPITLFPTIDFIVALATSVGAVPMTTILGCLWQHQSRAELP